MATLAANLPIVPAPQTAELLGSWLLRIAALYSVSVPRLLAHAGLETRSIESAHWNRLPLFGPTEIERMSRVFACHARTIRKMQSRIGRERQSFRMGICHRCWQEDLAAARPLFWRRAWTDPLATTCLRHAQWLLPVDAVRLQKIRHYDELNAFALEVVEGQDEHPPSAAPALLCEALVLHHAMNSTRGTAWDQYAHLGIDQADQLHRVVCALVSMAFFYKSGSDQPGSFAQSLQTYLPEAAPIKLAAYALNEGDGACHHYRLPLRLECRQALLAQIAGLLAASPTRHMNTRDMSEDELGKWIGHAEKWPIQCTRILVPRVAEWIEAQRKPQAELKFSPAYFSRRRMLALPH